MNLNKSRIAVEGLNRTRLIKQLTKEGVCLENVSNIPGEPIKFTISGANKQKTFAILKKLCYNYTIEWDYGALGTLKKFLSRVGVALGAVLGVIAVVFLSNCALFVKTVGLDSTTSAEVELIVKKTVSLPSWSSSLSLEKIKSAALSVDGVAQCNVRVKGNYIIVDALPSKEVERETSQKEIVASDDAVITRIVTNSGTPLVKPGDVVKKGDLLISGEIKSVSDETVIQTVIPSGAVYGEVALRSSAIVGERKVVKRFTGRKTSRSFLLYGKYSPRSECPYLQAETYVEICEMNLFLPLIYTKITYLETITEEIIVSLEDTASDLLRELRTFGADYVEKESRVSVLELGNGLKKVSVYVLVEKKISG